MSNPASEDSRGALQAAIAALQAQRELLGEQALALALQPLRERLARLQQPALERRWMTVLFADLAGSTAVVQGLDPEDALAVLGEIVERMAQIVECHGGRVLQFAGDGFKAVFGSARAQEDDARRALVAGLQMLQAARAHAAALRARLPIADLPLRIGAHSGMVALGAGYKADRTAVGAAVHVAARMEQSAPPWSMRISQETWTQVRGRFEVQALPPQAFKGLPEPMRSYLVLALRADDALHAERGLPGVRLPLIAREAELAQLQALVDAAAAGAQALTVVGDAGIGKSRLLRELAALLPAPRVLRVQAQHDAGMRPWGLLRQLLTRQLGIADSDPAPRARRRLLAGVRRLLGRRAQADAHCLGQLIGMDFGASPHLQALDPRALRDAAFAACLRALQRLAQQLGAPPLLLVEDLHWADAGSVELLQHLAAAGPKLACAIVASSRPTAPGAAAAATVGAPLALVPLPAAQARAMAQALLARLDAPTPALVDRIVAQSEGNPYYLEEIVRQLLDRGVIETGGEAWTLHPERLQALELPGTLVALLQARLDALPEPARGCARLASIVGHVFWDAALAQVDAQASAELPLLDRQGLVHSQTPSAIGDTAQWCFDHHLLHQVVYDTVPQRQRRSGHGAVLRWLLPRTRERGPEFLSLCALHAERAGEQALALDCYDRAAQAALQRHANASARDCLRRALELLGEADPARSDGLLRRLEELADMMGERQAQQALLDERERLLERHPDDTRQADLLFARALFEDRLNRYPQAAELARRAHACAERCAHWQVAAEAQGLLAWLAYATNHIAQAREWVDAALATVQRAEPALPICRAKLEVLSAMVARVQGQPALARTALLAALERAQASGVHRLVLGCHDNLAVLALDRHDHAEAQHWIDAMQALAERTGAQPRLAHALMHRAELACAEGEPQAALDAWRRSMAITRGNGDRRNLGAALARSGRLLIERAEWAAALAALDEAAVLFEDLAGGGDAALPRAHAAWCAWQLGRADEARGRAERAAQGLQLARLTDLAGSGLAARWALVQVWLVLEDGRVDDWLRRLRTDLDAAPDEPPALRAAVGRACARRFPA